MGFLTVGITHQTAPVSLRARVAFLPEQLIPALQDALQLEQVSEIAILSTCNRTEVYCFGDVKPERLCRWLSDFHQIHHCALAQYVCVYTEEAAIRHMMRVACGLDSLILGEPQVLGQMKSAYAVAREAGATGVHLSCLFQGTFTTAKQVRTHTAIGENPISVAYAAVTMSRRIFADLSRNTALLVGAGETIKLAACHLKEQGIGNIIVANRTLERALQLAERVGGHAVLLSDIPKELHKADIVITSTASQLPILGKGAVERALKKRRHAPVFMVDIAVPRDIEPEVSDLADVYLYTVDDLHEVVQDSLRSRQEAVQAAEDIIAAGCDAVLKRIRAMDVVDILKSYRERAEIIRDHEINKALRLLQRDCPVEQVLARMARSLTNKLIHTPCVQLRKVGSEGDMASIALAREFMDLRIADTLAPAPVKPASLPPRQARVQAIDSSPLRCARPSRAKSR